jgi:hypothetical protein
MAAAASQSAILHWVVEVCPQHPLEGSAGSGAGFGWSGWSDLNDALLLGTLKKYVSHSRVRLGPMYTKVCGRCEVELPLGDFNFRDRARTKLQSYCRECSNAAWRTWYGVPENRAHHLAVLRRRRSLRIARHRALVRELKSKPCADCGGRFPPEVMDFDHLRDKEDLISKLVYQTGTQRLLAELDKCEVVCANCHRLRTSHRLDLQ